MTLSPKTVGRLAFLCTALAILGGCAVTGPGYYAPGYDDCGYYSCSGYYGGYYGPAYYGSGPGFYFNDDEDDDGHEFHRFHREHDGFEEREFHERHDRGADYEVHPGGGAPDHPPALRRAAFKLPTLDATPAWLRYRTFSRPATSWHGRVPLRSQLSARRAARS